MNQMSAHTANHEWKVDYFTSPVDANSIRYAVYQSKSIEPKRFIVFLNGRAEWIEKYAALPHWLDLPAGYGLLTWDHRGQGASGGRPAHVDHYDHFVTDAAALIQKIVGNKPFGIIAHSMGGLISLYATLKEAISPSFLALSSPLLMLPNYPINRRISRPLSRILSYSPLKLSHTGANAITKQPFYNNTLTHSYQGFCNVLDSPYHALSPTIGWVNASFQATEFVNNSKNLQKLKCPTLIICGSNERVVDYMGFPAWVSKAREYAQAEVELVKINAARHEILNEIPRYREQAIRKIVAWAKANHFLRIKPVQQKTARG